jgi:hypothetical protein
MILALLYWFALAVSSFYVAWVGDRDEKVGIALYGAASIVSAYVVSPLTVRFRGLEWSVMIVDLSLLVPFVLIVLRSQRRWPLWMTAFQVVSIVANTVVLSQASRRAYAETLYLLSFAILFTFVAGGHGSRKQRETELIESRARKG